MGRNSSGTRGGLQPGDATFKGKISKPEPLVNMKDPAAYKATKEAISRYHAVMGVRQRSVKLADLPAGTYGVHVTVNGKSDGCILTRLISTSQKVLLRLRIEKDMQAAGVPRQTSLLHTQ